MVFRLTGFVCCIQKKKDIDILHVCFFPLGRRLQDIIIETKSYCLRFTDSSRF